MLIHGGSMGPVVGRRSFLFTTDMANNAVKEIQQQPTFENLAQWHLMRIPPSTSRGFAQFFWIYHFVKISAVFEQQQMLQSQQSSANANNMGRSPPVAPQSRATKRKASAQTTTVLKFEGIPQSSALNTSKSPRKKI